MPPMFLDQLQTAKEVQFTFGRKALDQKAKNYVIYCRESDERNDRNTSIPDQIDQCRELATRLDLNVIGEVREKISARKYGRPKFTNLLNAIKGIEPLVCLERGVRRKVYPDGIIAWHPDRLSRNWHDSGEIIERLDDGMIADMKFVMYQFHNDSSGKEHLAMEFARAKGYSDHLQDNVMRGLISQEIKGKGVKPLPPAYDVIRRENENDTEHLKIVATDLHEHWRSAYRWRIEGKTFEEIAFLLVRAGYEDTRREKKKSGGYKTYDVCIDKDYVRRHIKNPIHCGLLVTGLKGKEPRMVDLTEVYPTEYGHEFAVVITIDEFKQVNPELFSDTAQSARKTRKRSQYPLAGKVLCEERYKAKEQAGMTANTPKSGSGKDSPRFTCQRCKPQHSICFDDLFAEIEKTLNGISITEMEHKMLVVTEWERYQHEREEIESSKRQILALKSKNGHDTQEAEETLNTMQYSSQKASQKEIEVQKRKVTRLHEEAKSLNKREEAHTDDGIVEFYNLDAFLELARNASNWWNKANHEQKRKMADILVSNVYIEGNIVASVSLNEPFDTWSTRGKDDDGRGDWTRTSDPLLPKQVL